MHRRLPCEAMMFTPEQRQKIMETMNRILAELWHMKWQDKVAFITQGYSEKKTDQIIQVLEPMQPMKSFSKAITDDGKHCPTCGHLWVIYKKALRKNLLKHLRLLTNADRAMSSNEIFQRSHDRLAYVKFPEFKLWGFIRKVDGTKFYEITEKGRQFIRGEIAVPEFLYTLHDKPVATPEGCDEPRMVFVHEVAPHDFSDASRHVEEASPVA
jgi:hypothetical protein